jgi:CRISPR-associated endonuclease/helicase Cas3
MLKQNKYRGLWAKTAADGWHPLMLHLLDVATAADAVLAREPESSRQALGEALGLDWERARPWLLLLAALHDLGKACPAFQGRWPQNSADLKKDGLTAAGQGKPEINHAWVSQAALIELLAGPGGVGWKKPLAKAAAAAAGCHHGLRADNDTLEDMSILGWADCRRYLFDLLLEVFRPGPPPARREMSGPDFMRLAGWISVSDWIGSNRDWFPFGAVQELDDLIGWRKL